MLLRQSRKIKLVTQLTINYMKNKPKQKKKKLVKKIDKKKIIFGLVLLVVAYFLFKPKKDVLQDWEEIWGVSPESNPDDLSFEEWNELQPEIYRQEPGMLEYLRDCPFFKASTKDPDSMDIFIDETSCDRKTHVETGAIIIQNYDFEKGVQEFKAWLKKNKLKLGKDVIVEDFYPWDYEKICKYHGGSEERIQEQRQSILNYWSCIKDVDDIKCIIDENHNVFQYFSFVVKKNEDFDACKQSVLNKGYDAEIIQTHFKREE